MITAFIRGAPRQLVALRELLAIVTSADRHDALSRYSAFFAQRMTPDHKAFGEITPSYCLLPAEGFSAILSLYEEAKFIYLMRDPVDRFWSAVRHKARGRQLDPGADLEHCLHDDRFLARSDYRRTLHTLDASVPQQQVLTLFYEDLFSPEDDSTLRRVTAFLGIDHQEGDRDSLVLEGSGSPISEEAAGAVLAALSDQYRYVAARFSDVPERWRTRMQLMA